MRKSKAIRSETVRLRILLRDALMFVGGCVAMSIDRHEFGSLNARTEADSNAESDYKNALAALADNDLKTIRLYINGTAAMLARADNAHTQTIAEKLAAIISAEHHEEHA